MNRLVTRKSKWYIAAAGAVFRLRGKTIPGLLLLCNTHPSTLQHLHPHLSSWGWPDLTFNLPGEVVQFFISSCRTWPPWYCGGLDVRQTRSLLEWNFVRSPIDGHYLLRHHYSMKCASILSNSQKKTAASELSKEFGFDGFRPQKPLSPPVSV